jgi:putative drug exporter of the RND superfamily
VLIRLADFCYHRRRWVVVAWIVLLFAITFLSGAAGKAFTQSVTLEGSDSQIATDLLKANSPVDSSFLTGDIVFKADAGVTDPAVQAKLTQLFTTVGTLEGVARVDSPYAPTGARQVAPGGKIAYATVHFNEGLRTAPASTITAVDKLIADAQGNGLQLEIGGFAFSGDHGPGSTELLGLAAAALILLFAFGSVLAMGLPILTALFGLGVGIGIVGLLSHVLTMPEFSIQLASMIGLGVGIDYALFIVTRYRQGLADGLEPERAVVRAIDTAGRAVLFAGITVVISLAGMLLMGISFVQGLGLASAAVVAVTMAAALTLLPAVLGFAGYNIDKLSIPGLGKNAHGGREGFWFKWSRFLQRHPWPFAVGGIALLLALSIPMLSLQLGSSDDSSLPTTSTVRRAYDLKAEGFGAGASAPLLLVAELPAGSAPQALLPIVKTLQDTPGVAAASPPIPAADGKIAIMQVIPTTSGQDPATTELMQKLRDTVLPQATAGTGITVHVGGVTAIFADMASKLQARLPIFIGVVLGLSFLLLMVVFRSILVPVKAVIMNLLSISAAYGILVAVFQFGWGKSLFGLGNTGPIESFVPMMMFAILFGLSMDYEVFLLSRIKEEYDRTGDNELAVADGLSATARVITAAALIMVTVFGSFILGDQRVVKEFGLGLALAVLIDASIVRMILVPATMELLGDANWWFPKWLQWLPHLNVEGHTEDEFDRDVIDLLEHEPAKVLEPRA